MIISSLGSLILALLPPPSAPQSTLALLAHALLTQPAHASPFHNMNMPSSSVPSAKAVQARQVLFFSVANTLARLIGGAAADFLSAPLNTVVILPPSSNSRRGRRWFSGRLRRPRISKITFFLAVLLPLGMVYLWAAVGGLTHASSLPILTVVVGLSYGLIFTLAPALIAQVFGLQTFGRFVSFLASFGNFPMRVGSLTPDAYPPPATSAFSRTLWRPPLLVLPSSTGSWPSDIGLLHRQRARSEPTTTTTPARFAVGQAASKASYSVLSQRPLQVRLERPGSGSSGERGLELLLFYAILPKRASSPCRVIRAKRSCRDDEIEGVLSRAPRAGGLASTADRTQRRSAGH